MRREKGRRKEGGREKGGREGGRKDRERREGGRKEGGREGRRKEKGGRKGGRKDGERREEGREKGRRKEGGCVVSPTVCVPLVPQMCMTNWSVEPSSSTLPQLTSVTSSPLTPITQMQQVRLKSVLKSILMPLKTDIISDSLVRSGSSNSLRVRFQGVKDHYSIVCISVSLRSPLVYVSRYLCQRLTRLMWLDIEFQRA